MLGRVRLSKNTVIFDANMILRYILEDNEKMADEVEEYIALYNVVITLEVVAEVVYVLRKVYCAERNAISEMLTEFVSLVDCRERDVLYVALIAYATYNLDFVDCVLYAYHKINGVEIATFDKKLLRLLNSEEELGKKIPFKF